MSDLTPRALERHFNELLKPELFDDYAPNGLQIEGDRNISRIAIGVSANQTFIDAAIEQKVDAAFVHHGFFWKGEPSPITGYRGRRIRSLIQAGISLYAYHLPLDAHPTVGNNVQVLHRAGARPTSLLGPESPAIGWKGEFDEPVSRKDVLSRLTRELKQSPISFSYGPEEVRSIAVVTGGGARWFEHSLSEGVDLFISGEPSEQSQGIAADCGGNFAAFGHHATERCGPIAIGEHLEEQLGLTCVFIDVPNPV